MPQSTQLVSVATECVSVSPGSSVVPQRGREKVTQEAGGKEVGNCWKGERSHDYLLGGGRGGSGVGGREVVA